MVNWTKIIEPYKKNLLIDLEKLLLIAKGTLDDKGPTFMIYFAIKILKNLCYHLNQRIYLIFGTDEENN